MAKYKCYPLGGSGSNTFSDNLVGLQITDGGGLTLGKFGFSTGFVEKSNRSFETGTFSAPLNLQSLGVDTLEQGRKIFETNFKVYPNFEQTDVLNFTQYGSLVKRFEAAITNIINFFPGALEVNSRRPNYVTGATASGITTFAGQDLTSIIIPVDAIRNPFGIDFTTGAKQNIENLTTPVSKYRNITETYRSYILQINGNDYEIALVIPTTSLTGGTLSVYVVGDPFSGNSISYDNFIIRLNDTIVNEVFNLELDEIEEILLNRYIIPKYTAKFQVTRQGDDGTEFLSNETITWPLDGTWNIDIRTNSFTNYLTKLYDLAADFDLSLTNLISRFYVTDALQEFDTPDFKVDKVLKIYGRSFDETKKYIDAISFANSVNYNIGNDIPSKLVSNLAQTLGWDTNISPITNLSFIDTIYGTTENAFPAFSTSQTIDDLNYQYYRNLVLNSAYLFKSKGTRKAIEFLMKLVGAPDALLDFTENVYLVDSKINMNQFNLLYNDIIDGTYTPINTIYDPTNVFTIQNIQYTGYQQTSETFNVDVTQSDYPIDANGYPSMPTPTDNFFFQKGAGWFESTPQHRSPVQATVGNSTFTGQNVDVQTSLESFTYGNKFLDEFRNFPYMNLGFNLYREVDNKKSWTNSDDGLRDGVDNLFDSYYLTSDDRLVLNVKNTDIFLNPAQALVYDVWYMSRTENYPIPITGLSSPYPQEGGIDSTFIDPKPQITGFYDFAKTFWHNTINARNRQYSSDGKTSGYPTLQSIFWKYTTMLQDVGIQNSNFNYTNMINYINGMGDLWLRLIEQFVPATTIWNGGTKFENSIFHRQKFIYRRQRECQVTSVGIPGASAGNTINPVISLITSNTPRNTIEIPPGQTGNGSFVYYYFIISIPYLYNGVEYKNEYQTSSFGPYYYNNTPASATLIGYFVDYLQTNTPFVTIKRLLNDDSGTIVNNFTTEAASGFLISHNPTSTPNGSLSATNTNTNYSPLGSSTTYSPSIIVKLEYQQ
jgi:hypothetical protein